MTVCRLLTVLLVLLLLSVSAWAKPMQDMMQKGGDEPLQAEPLRGWPGGDMFPGHGPAYTIISLTNNGYGDDQAFPEGYYVKYAGFNADGTRIAVSARNQVAAVSQAYEIWVMDYDASTQTISNYQQITTNAGVGEVYWNSMCSWSRTDPDLLLYLEIHNTTPNTIMTYDLGAGVGALLYDPALDTNGDDVTNPGFYADYDDQVIFGSGYNTGNDRILLFDGSYPSTTISSLDKNLDPASNYDGTRVTYYSTNATYTQGSIYSDFLSSAWTEVTGGFGDPGVSEVPGYWAFYSGKPTNMIVSLRDEDGWSSAGGLGLYHASGTMITDITGSGDSTFKWTYANHNWQSSAGEVLFRSEEFAHTGYGNNLFLAIGQATVVWVDDDWTGPNDCGALAWGFDAFASIQEAVDAVTDGGTVNVYAGTYAEQVVIGKDVQLVGTGAPVVVPPTGGVQGYTIEESGALLYPMLFAYGGTDDGTGSITGPETISLTVSGFAIDHGNTVANNRTVGALFRNCNTATISDNEVYGLLPGTGNPQTLGVAVYGNSDVTITGNTVYDWTRGGIVVTGDVGALTDPQGTVTQNAVIGEGPLGEGYWAQNGIQASYGALVAIEDNEVSDIAYTGPDWAASGINLYLSASGVTVTGNDVHDCQAALYLTDVSDAAMSANTFTDNEFVIVIGGSNITFEEETFTNNDIGIWIGDATNSSVARCEFIGNGTSLAADGIAANLTFMQNEIANSTSEAFLFDEYAGSEPTGMVVVDNSITGNTVGVNNLTTVITDASANYWGDITGPATGAKSSVDRLPRPARCGFVASTEETHVLPSIQEKFGPGDGFGDAGFKAGTGDGVSANVDYTPWLTGGNPAGTGFEGDFATLYCDDDSPQSGVVATIQEAVNLVDVNGTVNVVAGTYEEQVEVAKNLSLLGEDAATTTLQSPVSLPLFFNTGSSDNYPVLYVHGASVDVADLTLDGLGRGNANNRFTGVGVFNGGGSLTDMTITGVRDEPFSGSQHGVSVYAFVDDGGPWAFDMTNVTVTDMQKTGIVFNGDGLTVNATNCSVTGQGHTTTTAQNGFQPSYGADVTLTDCSVADIGYTGEGWVASGILLYQAGTVNINGGSVTNTQASVIYQETDGVVDGLAVTSGSIASAVGISIRDYAGVKAAMVNGHELREVSPFDADLGFGSKAVTTNVVINDVTLTGVDEAGSYGIAAWALGDNVNVNLTESDVTNWEIGLVAYEDVSTISFVADHNTITDNALGSWSNAATNQVQIENYWGSVLCADVQAQVSGSVQYEPWCNGDFSKCDFQCAVNEVWVDDDWDGSTAGDDLGGGMYFGYNAFATIPTGVDGVTDGGLVHVLPGAYPTGQLLFDKNVTISGDEFSLPNITATEATVDPTSWFHVDSQTVNFDHLAFDASGFAVKYIIGYWDGGGTVTSCTFANVQQSLYIGCAVLHYGDTDFAIEDCEFTNCQRQGVFVYAFPDRTRVIRGNTYTGKGAVDGLDYAVEVGGGASALIENNVITNCLAEAASDGSASAGILATDYYGGGTAATITGNIFENNTMGVAVGYDSTDATVVAAPGNRYVGNTSSGLSQVGSVLVEATASWWDDINGPPPATKTVSHGFSPMQPDGTYANAPRSKDAYEGLIHFSPWVASDGFDADAGTDGWQPNLSRVGVSTNGTIQEGVDLVDVDGTVMVTAGVYEEQVDITKDLTLSGDGLATTTIQSPPTLAESFATGSNNNFPVVFIHDADVDVDGFTVDGLGRGNANYRFVGVAFFNGGGSLTDMLVTGVRDEPFSGSQHGVSVYAYNDDGGPYAIDLIGVEVADMQKTGIALGGEGLTATVDNCTVTGQGPTTVTAQNGIQMAYGTGGSITNCNIADIGYTGGSWIASGVLLYDGTTVDITGGSITNCQVSVVYQETDGVLDGTAINTNFEITTEAISVRDYGSEKATITDRRFADTSPLEDPRGPHTKAVPTTVTVQDATITGADFADSYGIAAWSLGDDVLVTVDGCTITDWDIALVAYEDVSTVSFTAVDNSVTSSAWAFSSNAALAPLAEHNYWGTINCPQIQVLMDGDVDFDPWCNDDFSFCDYTCNLLEAWVDDDYCETCLNDSHTWQYDCFDVVPDAILAVSDGGLIHVLAGNYDLPLDIENRQNLTIDGASKLATIFKPATTLGWNVATYGETRQAAIRLVSSTNIKLSNMTMDFDLIKANNVFGMLWWNSGGEISDNRLKNMSTPDYYEFIAYVRAPDFDEATRMQLNVLRNDFKKTGRVALITHDWVNSNIQGNTFDQDGDDFGYALEIGSMSTAMIKGNSFRGYNTWAASDKSSSAAIYVENAYTSGVGPVTKLVTVDSNVIDSCQYGVYLGNSYPGFTGDVDVQCNITRNTISDNGTTGSEASGAILITDEGADAGSSVAATITDNELTANGDYGVYIYTNGNGALDVTMLRNKILDHYTGVTVKDFGAPSTSTYAITVYDNWFGNALNAEDDVVGGFWDDGVSVGNCWNDLESNSGYPTNYLISGTAGTIDRYPTMSCFGCCTGPSVGNVDGSPDNQVTMGDLTVLIDHLFISLAPLVCPEEGNVDMSLDGQVTMGDLTVLIDHLFISLAPLPACP